MLFYTLAHYIGLVLAAHMGQKDYAIAFMIYSVPLNESIVTYHIEFDSLCFFQSYLAMQTMLYYYSVHTMQTYEWLFN